MYETDRITILIADDHPLILAGLAALIEAEPSLELLGKASDGNQAVAQFAATRPDLVLMDLNMPECGGIDAIRQIRCLDPGARIVILTTYEGEEDLHRGLSAGAAGYLLKDAPFEQLMDCIRNVVAGRRYLTPGLAVKLASRINANKLSARELDILAHLAAGKSNKLIARDAGIGVGTVKFHVNSILAKLNVASRTEAACVATRRGMVQQF